MDLIREAWKNVKRTQKYIAWLSNLIILSISFLLLVLLKYSNGSLIYFFGNVLLCLLMWFFIVYMKVVHPVYRHNKKIERDDTYGIIGWIVFAQLLLIASQVIISFKS